MITIEIDLFTAIALAILLILPTLVFSTAYLMVAIQEHKNKKKWIKKILTEDNGKELEL